MSSAEKRIRVEHKDKYGDVYNELEVCWRRLTNLDGKELCHMSSHELSTIISEFRAKRSQLMDEINNQSDDKDFNTTENNAFLMSVLTKNVPDGYELVHMTKDVIQMKMNQYYGEQWGGDMFNRGIGVFIQHGRLFDDNNTGDVYWHSLQNSDSHWRAEWTGRSWLKPDCWKTTKYLGGGIYQTNKQFQFCRMLKKTNSP